MKYMFLLLAVNIMNFSLIYAKTVELNCTYEIKTNWWAIDFVYFCDQGYDVPLFDVENMELKINGEHPEDFENSDVLGFRNNQKNLERFPRGLELFFPNLEFIAIWRSNLREIHQQDIAPFRKLRVISWYGNKLLNIEKDLFKYNTELEYISLSDNEITTVHPIVFNHLKKLHSLRFANKCVNRSQGNDIHAVRDLIDEIVEKCSPYEINED